MYLPTWQYWPQIQIYFFFIVLDFVLPTVNSAYTTGLGYFYNLFNYT